MMKMASQIQRVERPRYRKCEICGKEVKSQGYGGHLFLEHGKKTGVVASVEEVQERLSKLERRRQDGSSPSDEGELSSRLQDVEDKLEDCEKIVEDYEHLTKEKDGRIEELEERVNCLEDFIMHLKFEREEPGFLSGLLGGKAEKGYFSMSVKDYDEIIGEEEEEEPKKKKDEWDEYLDGGEKEEEEEEERGEEEEEEEK